MYKSKIKKAFDKSLKTLCIYNDVLCFELHNPEHVKALKTAAEMADRLDKGNFIEDLNGRNPIKAAKDEMKAGNKMNAVYIINVETGRNLKEAKEFVDNGFKTPAKAI